MIEHSNCLDAMRDMNAASVDSVVTDPPYGLAFMGRDWDKALPDPAVWAELLRVAKPGAHLIAFGHPRLYHRLACAIEDAGWEVRDCLMWLYGSGFPKSLDVSKAIDKAAGAERVAPPGRHAATGTPVAIAGGDGRCVTCGRHRGGPAAACQCAKHSAPVTEAARQWSGWGTALKPAYEPILLARKPLVGNVAANVLAHGTGAINVDGCRIGTESTRRPTGNHSFGKDSGWNAHNLQSISGGSDAGRWPANLLLDEQAAAMLDEQTGTLRNGGSDRPPPPYAGDSGGASRFFYTAKASRSEREAGLNTPKGERRNLHPTVKPLSLMRWLVRLVTPPGGLVLDPFCGSGTTGVACAEEGFPFIGMEINEEYVEIASERIASVAPLLPVRTRTPRRVR